MEAKRALRTVKSSIPAEAYVSRVRQGYLPECHWLRAVSGFGQTEEQLVLQALVFATLAAAYLGSRKGGGELP